MTFVTEPPGPLKFPSVGATGLKTCGGTEHGITNLALQKCKRRGCRGTPKLGLLQRTVLGGSKRDPRLQSLGSAIPFAILCKAGQEAGGAEGAGSLTRSLFYLRSPLLPFSSNSGPPDGEWLPGPQGKVRIYPPKAMPPSGGVNQVSALEDEGGITSMLSL